MKRIRVLLSNMPRTLRDVLKQVVADQADMEVVGEISDRVGLLLAAGQTEADVVVMSLDDSQIPGICTHLLDEYPHIKILGVSGDGRRAILYELHPHQVPVGEVSPSGLLNAIRAAVQS